jgi:hypothetical protein
MNAALAAEVWAMGTRALTRVLDDDGLLLATIYTHWDGYPEGHGVRLAGFLAYRAIVDGIPSYDVTKTSNGMGCLAAELVGSLKDGIGGTYLVPTAARDEEYTYAVWPIDGKVRMRVYDQGTLIYSGDAVDFLVDHERGACDRCNFTYLLASRSDHCAECGTCWEHCAESHREVIA